MNDYNPKQALKNMESLADEVEQGTFLPKKFRKGVFTPEMRRRYVAYLRNEIRDVKARLKGKKHEA